MVSLGRLRPMFLKLARRMAETQAVSLQVSDGSLALGSQAEIPHCVNSDYGDSESQFHHHLASFHSCLWFFMPFAGHSLLLSRV